MTFAASLGWSLLRALAVTILAWPCCRSLVDWIDQDDGPRRSWRLAAVLLPFVYPELLVGYAYGWRVAGLPVWSEAACTVLMGLRVVPVGVVALLLTPASPVTASALFCRGLILHSWRDRLEWWRLWINGPVLRATPAWMLMLLVTFQQFELAALLKATSWTNWLVVQQVGGLSLAESLRVTLIPVVLQLGMIALAVVAVARCRRTNLSVSPEPKRRRPITLVILWLGCSWGLVIVWPSVNVIAGLPAGLAQLATQPLRMAGLSREVLGGLSVSTLAALIAWRVCVVLVGAMRDRETVSSLPGGGERSRIGVAPAVLITCAAIVPGLLGSLVLGLALVSLFQTPVLAWFYGSPVNWILGLTLSLLPRALLLKLWLGRSATSAEVIAGHLKTSNDPYQQREGRRVQWRMVEQPRFLAVAALVYWGYLDLTTAYLLAPTGMPSGVVRLYNFMHFGRTAALSAEAAVLLAAPLLITVVVWFLWRGFRS